MVTASALHLSTHIVPASRITASTLHLSTHLPAARTPAQVSTLHIRERAGHVNAPVYPGQPFTYPGGFPDPATRTRKLVLHLLGRDGHDYGPLTKDRNRHLQEVLNDTGSGSADVRQNEPLVAELVRGRILSAYVNGYGPVFDFLIEPGTENRVRTRDEAATQGLTVGGRGTLVVLSESVIHPQRLTGPPVEQVIVFDFSHPAYDDSGWVAATEIADQGNNPSSLWIGKPSQWNVPSSKWIWSSDGSMFDAPGPATRYFRKRFTIHPGRYALRTAGDNAYAFSMNGTPIVSAGDLLRTTGAFWRAQKTLVDVPDGENVFGIVGQNYAATVPGANPAGMLAVLQAINTDGIETGVMFSTNSTWLTYPDLTPGAFPGVTVGMAMIWLLEQAQALGALEHVTWDFTALLDSAGNAWDLVPAITCDVGVDRWVAFQRFTQAGLCDLRMVPGSPLRLQAFRHGEMVPDSTAEFQDPHLRELVDHDSPTIVNAYLVRYDSGFFTLVDEDSIAENGYIESYLAMGNLPADEALTRAQAQLALTKDPKQAPVTVLLDRHPDVAPYETYGVGSIVPTRTADGISDERVTSITIADSSDSPDEIDVIPTIRGQLRDGDDLIEQWLQTMSNGTQSGIFQGASRPPDSIGGDVTPSNEFELIHQKGNLKLGASVRHSIRRTGSAQNWYLFLAGQLATANITAQILIDDVVVGTATIIAGERRSPIVTFDPPVVVLETEDWWSVNVTAGTDGSDLSAHLIIQ